MTRVGEGKFRAYSAGSHPSGAINPGALRWLQAGAYPLDQLRSKSWDEFESPGAPVFDFVVTVCDNAANEVCPIWPGRPVRSHWGVADPAAVQGPVWEIDRAFSETARMLGNRIRLFASLPLDKLDALSVKREMDAIGAVKDAPELA